MITQLKINIWTKTNMLKKMNNDVLTSFDLLFYFYEHINYNPSVRHY